ncbi:MAG: DUF1254 domain-containing protein [Aquihabitans sp.]
MHRAGPDRPPSAGLAIGRRRFLVGSGAAAGSLVLLGLPGCSSGDGPGSDGTPASTATTGPSEADALVEAFYAGVPLVVTMRTMQTFAGLVGINHLFPTKALSTADSRFVVAPNHDTLYVIAVLDVAAAAQILTLPDITDRYHVIQVLDAWMGGLALLGTRETGGKAGRWAITREGVDVEVPDGVIRIESPTSHVFILGRVRATEDPADVAAAAAVARSITMLPLPSSAPSAGGSGATPTPTPTPTLTEAFGPPNEVGANGAAFFDELGSLLGADPPATPAPSKALAAVNDLVAAGTYPTTEHPARTPELEAAVDEGMAGLERAFAGSMDLVNGWAVNLGLGRSDDRLSLRDQAVIARYFWGPVPAEEAVYPRAVRASDGKPLDGSKRYRIRFAGDDLPPVDAFWSLTVYGEDLYFVPNEIDRYSISGDTPDLVTAPDGSIEVLLSTDRPDGGDVNWLPTPDGPFTLVMRLYLPQQPILDGEWDYPTIDVVD